VRSRTYPEPGAIVCPNPVCNRAWHGLAHAAAGPSWPECEGSWAYEHRMQIVSTGQ